MCAAPSPQLRVVLLIVFCTLCCVLQNFWVDKQSDPSRVPRDMVFICTLPSFQRINLPPQAFLCCQMVDSCHSLVASQTCKTMHMLFVICTAVLPLHNGIGVVVTKVPPSSLV